MEAIIYIVAVFVLAFLIATTAQKAPKKETKLEYSDYTYAYHKDSNKSIKPDNYPVKPLVKSSVLFDEKTGNMLQKI